MKIINKLWSLFNYYSRIYDLTLLRFQSKDWRLRSKRKMGTEYPRSLIYLWLVCLYSYWPITCSDWYSDTCRFYSQYSRFRHCFSLNCVCFISICVLYYKIIGTYPILSIPYVFNNSGSLHSSLGLSGSALRKNP